MVLLIDKLLVLLFSACSENRNIFSFAAVAAATQSCPAVLFIADCCCMLLLLNCRTAAAADLCFRLFMLPGFVRPGTWYLVYLVPVVPGIPGTGTYQYE